MSTTMHRIARFVGLVPPRHGRPAAAPAPAPVDPDATQEFRITREDWDVHSGRHPYGGA